MKNEYDKFMSQTSEEKLHIIHPIEHQCSEIDNMIDAVNQSVSFSKTALIAIDNQTVVQANKEVLARISNFKDQLEEFRAAIEHTRRWGGEWKNLAKQLLEKHDPMRLDPNKDPDIPF